MVNQSLRIGSRKCMNQLLPHIARLLNKASFPSPTNTCLSSTGFLVASSPNLNSVRALLLKPAGHGDTFTLMGIHGCWKTMLVGAASQALRRLPAGGGIQPGS